MLIWRIVLAALGIAGLLYGISRLFLDVSLGTLTGVGIWLLAMLIIHDGILSPLIIALGFLLRRVFRPRARTFVQAGLIMAGMVTVIAIPMIIKQGTYPPVKALLEQDYRVNLAILIGIIAAGCAVAYAIRVARDHGDSATSEEDRLTQRAQSVDD